MEAGASEAQVAAMRAVGISVADLSGLHLASSSAGAITVDIDAAGNGWFIEPTIFTDVAPQMRLEAADLILRRRKRSRPVD